MAVISQRNFVLKPKNNLKCNSFESLTLSLTCPNWSNQNAVLFRILYRPPLRAYSEFLTEFSEFLSSTVLNCNKVIVGDFNVYVDVQSDCLNKAFSALIDDIGFTQNVNVSIPTHQDGHTLDLILTYGVEIHDLNVIPQNPKISDHCLLTFQFEIEDYSPTKDKIQIKRILSERTVLKYKEIIQPLFTDLSPLTLLRIAHSLIPINMIILWTLLCTA